MCSPDNTIKLNVGGSAVFQSTHATLTKYNGYFKTLLDIQNQVEKNRFGYIFIDRDPTHFRLILNFMRDGDVILPDSIREIGEVMKEAEYYRLGSLIDLCKSQIQKLNGPTVEIPKKLRILENYDQVLQVVTNPQKPVLIIYFLHGPDGTIDVPFNPTDFIKKNEMDFEIYFKRIEYNTPLPNSHLILWRWRIYYKDKNYGGESSRDFLKKLDAAVVEFKKKVLHH